MEFNQRDGDLERTYRQPIGRRGFIRASAVGAGTVAALPLMSESAQSAPAPSPRKPQPKSKTNRALVDMGKTYVNPIALPDMEVRNSLSRMPTSDRGIADSAAMREILAKETWVEEDGRRLLGQSKTGFRLVTENAFRAVADFSAVNYDGTIYLYCSGKVQNPDGDRTVYSTRDFRNWQHHSMNVGVTAPTAVRSLGKYYLAGNGSPVYVADSPTGPWRELGRFTRPNGTAFGAGDVQFFLDEDERLYLSWNIGAPIMAAELDPKNPSRLITEPVVIFDFEPTQEWMHFGDNKQAYNVGYTEGSQIFKVGDFYYVAVASGGTEHTTYSTGLMRSSEGPLSGYEFQSSNPIGHSIGGNFPSAVYPNAGHGSFVKDESGNLIFFYTYVVAYEDMIERRLGMDVCRVDDSNSIVCELSNTPQLVPGVSTHADAGLYNVSTNSQAYWASSYAAGRTPYYATDRTLSTWWEPADGDTSPSFIVGLANPYRVSAIQIHWKELGVTFTAKNAVKYMIEYYDIGANAWSTLVDRGGNTRAFAIDYLTFGEVLTHAIRLKILGTTENIKVGVQQLNVFGENYTLVAEKGMLDLRR
ncbi:family 43 glycosylhydrolase [Streptomyces sp. NPDC056405]|uniref:family 43 glycosylhydrolase n=1 Tax=Streptomyces sp. NPDC056405 TaxID=3345811 RepID=UPI0035DC63DD